MARTTTHGRGPRAARRAALALAGLAALAGAPGLHRGAAAAQGVDNLLLQVEVRHSARPERGAAGWHGLWQQATSRSSKPRPPGPPPPLVSLT